MKILEAPHVDGNFGDMLNGWLWPDLLPGVFDDDPRVRFIGIGTILDRQLPPAPLSVVFGSGTGYAPPPEESMQGPRWRVYGVRGPLTARVLGLGPEAALTDPAILLARHPAFAQPERGGVIFVPHWKSVRYGQWREACALAGIEFVDPCGAAHAVVRRIAGARKVIAESMHAAIVADAFRVPWVPVVLSRELAPFKWSDWAATLGLRYEPRRLGPSSPLERWRDTVLRHSAFGHPGDGAACEGRLHWSDEALLNDHAALIARMASPTRWRASVLAEALLKRAIRFGGPLHARVAGALYTRLREEAARQLKAAARDPGWLSTDAAHQHALARCEHALHCLVQDHRRGLLRPSDEPRDALPPPAIDPGLRVRPRATPPIHGARLPATTTTDTRSSR